MHRDSLSRHNVPPIPRMPESPRARDADKSSARETRNVTYAEPRGEREGNARLSERTLRQKRDREDAVVRTHFPREENHACRVQSARGESWRESPPSLFLSHARFGENLVVRKGLPPSPLSLSLSVYLSHSRQLYTSELYSAYVISRVTRIIICKCRTDTARCRHKFSPGVKRVREP